MALAMEANSVERAAIRTLATFVTSSPRSYGPVALERSRFAILDTVGCMIFGQSSPEAQAARSAVSAWGKGPATVVGSNAGLPPPWAAFVNATAAHALDYDDWDDPSLVHTSAVLLPAILAAATESEADGADIIDAHIVGVEALLRIGEAVNPSHYWNGWHATATIGAIGAAAAVSRVLGLDEDEAANALSIATSMAGGYVSQFGTMTKPMHAGFAAKAGVFAASLAKAGTSAQEAALDGPVSFRSTTSNVEQDAFLRAFAKLGTPWAIADYGMHIKLSPSCGGTHRVIEAALTIKKDNAFDTREIQDIEVNVPEFLIELLPYKVPNTRPEALFSLPYCVAAALRWGKVGIDEFSDDALNDDVVRDLSARVRLTTRAFDYQTHLFVKGSFDIVTVSTKDGRKFSASIDIPYGAPPRFADQDTVEQKFMDCARRGVPESQAAKIIELLRAPASEWSPAALCKLLSPLKSQTKAPK